MTAPAQSCQQINADALAGILERLASSQKACFDAGQHIAAMDIQSARATLASLLSAPAASTGEPDWWRWRFLSCARGWSKWIALNDDEVSAFRDLQAHGLEAGTVELQPLYAAPPASGDVRAAVIEELAADFEDSIHLVWDSQQIADRIREFAAGGQHG